MTKTLFFTFSSETGAEAHILDIDAEKDAHQQAIELLGEDLVILSAKDAFDACAYVEGEIVKFNKENQ